MSIPTKGNWGLIPAGGPLGDMVHEVTVPLLGPTQFGQTQANDEDALSLPWGGGEGGRGGVVTSGAGARHVCLACGGGAPGEAGII